MNSGCSHIPSRLDRLTSNEVGAILEELRPDGDHRLLLVPTVKVCGALLPCPLHHTDFLYIVSGPAGKGLVHKAVLICG